MVINKEFKEISQSIDALSRLSRALLYLYNEIGTKDQKMFLIFAQGPLDEIKRICNELEFDNDQQEFTIDRDKQDELIKLLANPPEIEEL